MTTSTSARNLMLEEKSVEIIRRYQHQSGAYPASPGFSAYDGYCWLRDGAFISYGMSQASEFGSSQRFLEWSTKTVTSMEASIEYHFKNYRQGRPFDRGSYLPTRFQIGATQDIGEEWPNFQIDGYGTWIWALRQFQTKSGRNVDFAAKAVNLSVKYLLAAWQEPCFDWWEEYPDMRHTSTLGSVVAGLRAALELGVLDTNLEALSRSSLGDMEVALSSLTKWGYLPKWAGDDRIDASALALLSPLEVIPPSNPAYSGTFDRATEDLLDGVGVHRYQGDVYYGGGLWPLLSGYYGLAALELGKVSVAQRVLDWIADTQGVGGELPEQVNSHLLAPEREAEWISKWGPSATPLLWTHGMYLALANELRRT